MTKAIQYPTQEWLDKWYDTYEEKHPNERIDYDALKEQAETDWWDKQVDKGNPTPFDLTTEEKKESKKARGGARAERKAPNYSLEGKTPRVRKPNEEKRFLVNSLKDFLSALSDVQNAEIANPEKEVTFAIGENHYSISLICHRKPKTE